MSAGLLEIAHCMLIQRVLVRQLTVEEHGMFSSTISKIVSLILTGGYKLSASSHLPV